MFVHVLVPLLLGIAAMSDDPSRISGSVVWQKPIGDWEFVMMEELHDAQDARRAFRTYQLHMFARANGAYVRALWWSGVSETGRIVPVDVGMRSVGSEKYFVLLYHRENDFRVDVIRESAGTSDGLFGWTLTQDSRRLFRASDSGATGARGAIETASLQSGDGSEAFVVKATILTPGGTRSSREWALHISDTGFAWRPKGE